MAENPSGPQVSTAVGSSSADGSLRARLPQAQAENILASLAGRSSPSPEPGHNGHVPPKPVEAPPSGGEPRAQVSSRTSGLAPGPGTAGAGPQPSVGSGRPKPPSVATTVGNTDHAGPGAAAAKPKERGSYSNDILPDLPKARFRFRLR
jgi:hypothetical protein